MYMKGYLMEINNDTEQKIYDACMNLAIFLIEKNRKYGNSALDPVRILSKSPPDEQIKVRMDDKLSRVMRGSSVPKEVIEFFNRLADEDVQKDFVGYWILKEVLKDTK